MRIAVAVPSLEAAAPQRRALDAMLGRMVEEGCDVEAFAEHDRTSDVAPFPIHHYLRLPERHVERAFDIALYPLGRDASPYQGVWALMHRFPGVVWFLDAVAHHLAVGGIALMGDWASYREMLDDAYGDTGAAVAQTVASNWGTGALFRRYDLVAAAARGQRCVLASWPALARRIESRLDDVPVGVAPLGVDAPSVVQAAAAGTADTGRIALMSVNESYATTAVRAAAAALELDDTHGVTLCLSEPIYKAEGKRVAEHLGVLERIDWRLTTSPGELAEIAATPDVLVWLAEELQGGHRVLLLDGMRAGKATVVPRCGLYDDLPDGAVARLDLGRTLPVAFAALLDALRADPALCCGLGAAGRAFAGEEPDAASAARTLIDHLDAAATGFTLREAPVSAPAWAAVRAGMLDATLPGAVAPVVERHIADLLPTPGPKG
ncbi:MAG: hypothetical protein PVJ49_03990 [Acidobacteriota bacterium]|jgi:hypothetical protein